MAVQSIHLPKTPCSGPSCHQKYCYSFGIYQALRTKSLCGERSTTIKITQADMDPMLGKEGKDYSEYRLIHKYERLSPYCIYILKHSETEPASKVSLDRFVAPSGENGWKFVTNVELLPIHLPLGTKVYQRNSYASTRIFQLIFCKRCNAMADEQDVVLEEMREKLTQGELDITRVLMEMTKLVGGNRKLSEELALTLTHTTSIQKEVKINQLCYQNIHQDLAALGFVVKATIAHSDFCLFGKSSPDLYF